MCSLTAGPRGVCWKPRRPPTRGSCCVLAARTSRRDACYNGCPEDEASPRTATDPQGSCRACPQPAGGWLRGRVLRVAVTGHRTGQDESAVPSGDPLPRGFLRTGVARPERGLCRQRKETQRREHRFSGRAGRPRPLSAPSCPRHLPEIVTEEKHTQGSAPSAPRSLRKVAETLFYMLYYKSDTCRVEEKTGNPPNSITPKQPRSQACVTPFATSESRYSCRVSRVTCIASTSHVATRS